MSVRAGRKTRLRRVDVRLNSEVQRTFSTWGAMTEELQRAIDRIS